MSFFKLNVCLIPSQKTAFLTYYHEFSVLILSSSHQVKGDQMTHLRGADSFGSAFLYLSRAAAKKLGRVTQMDFLPVCCLDVLCLECRKNSKYLVNTIKLIGLLFHKKCSTFAY